MAKAAKISREDSEINAIYMPLSDREPVCRDLKCVGLRARRLQVLYCYHAGVELVGAEYRRVPRPEPVGPLHPALQRTGGKILHHAKAPLPPHRQKISALLVC